MKADEIFMGWSYKDLPRQRKKEEAVKSFLSMADYWAGRVREAEEKLEAFLATKYSPGSGRLNGGHRGYVGGGLERRMAAEEHLRRNVAWAKKELERVLCEIEEGLSAVTTPKAADAVRLIHLEGCTAPKAGEILGVTDRHIRRLKSIGYQEMRLPDEWEERLAS